MAKLKGNKPKVDSDGPKTSVGEQRIKLAKSIYGACGMDIDHSDEEALVSESNMQRAAKILNVELTPIMDFDAKQSALFDAASALSGKGK